MTKDTAEPSGGRFHAVHAERDLESNWEVDLAKKLEEYLLKICSGEITGEEEGHISVNFAEAALLLQGSIQVYSRKVEYLYNLTAGSCRWASVQPEESGPSAVADEENDQFWGLDDIPGDCLDAVGDGGELESYLLSTTDLYQDFILLDTSDAVAVDEFLKDRKAGTTQNGTIKGTSTRKSFLSPRRSGGSALKPSAAKSQRANSINSPKNISLDDKMDSDNSDADDPWKPLNPHEPGNLRVKPFRKVKGIRRIGINVTDRVSMSTLFPLANCMLRRSLIREGNETGGSFFNSEADNDDIEYDSGNPDFDMSGNAYMDEDLPPCNKEHEIDDAHVKADEAVDLEYPNSQTSLEDLCRSHLNALLASIAETEKQTEMAARVSTWKQRIEHNLEEQESHPPFDIRDYGVRILDKLSLEASSSGVLSFSDLVKEQEKYCPEVLLLFFNCSTNFQVNNGEVDLERNGVGGEPVCYTAVNPFKLGKVSPIKFTPEVKRRRGSQYVEPVNLHSAG
ncbi:Condensin-2 complex subunit H2, C-terminal [Sesbania bispinosa]|nr:Condensin-2 complex subunit H2, C-terminal [Sesbania bispinosa]